jgi:uncharacterized Zn-binding protein involved in type VI secretion
MRLARLAVVGMLLAVPGPLCAQDFKEGIPGVITGGSTNVTIGGMPGTRKGDTTDTGGTIVQGSKDVFINGQPAVTTGDKSGCGGIVIGGGSNVFINGKPAARVGDLTTGCANK